jgi:sugar phosphate isomerase/epimerase
LKVGYCCNVHGGTTLDEVKDNLERYACDVKSRFCPNSLLPVGLWLSKSAIEGLGNANDASIAATEAFGDWIAQRGLDPFTFNGFPYGDFHQEVVKHDVYTPTWAETSRLDYTKKLAEIQSTLLDRAGKTEAFQTISTLPLGWPTVPKQMLFEDGKDYLRACAANLQALAEFLSAHENKTGYRAMVCIEPEPGCVFDSCDGIVRFFNEYLFSGNEKLVEKTRRHIGVCHDICHSAVMFEDQGTAVRAYEDAGISIGKVQVSSAIKLLFDEDRSKNELKLKQLESFAEPRYLHQTTIQRSDASKFEFYEDLALALRDRPACGEEWRVHFHVPVFARELDLISTTQQEIEKFIQVSQHLNIQHFEVETYAWNVLPQQYRGSYGGLADGIAEELNWFSGLIVG